MMYVDRKTAEDMASAFRRMAEAQTDGYRSVVEHANGVRERNARFARSVLGDAVEELNRQAESNRALAGELFEQSGRRREAYQALADRTVNTWMSLFDVPVGQYGRSLQLVEESVEKMVGTAREVATEAREPVTDKQTGTAATLPIEGYDGMNVEQVKKHLGGLNAAEIRTVRDHEKRNKNRETLMDLFDRRLKAKSA